MISLLHYLSYLSPTPTIKGQSACYINNISNKGDEIFITELLFSGFFNQFSPSELVCILSCFLVSEKGGIEMKKEEEKVEKEDKYKKLYENLVNWVEWWWGVINKEKKEFMIERSKEKEKFCGRYKLSLMSCFDLWCFGQKNFAEISQNVQGGILVRAIRRMDELLKELSECCAFIGNEGLKHNIEIISKGIRRGVPFAASLYFFDEK